MVLNMKALTREKALAIYRSGSEVAVKTLRELIAAVERLQRRVSGLARQWTKNSRNVNIQVLDQSSNPIPGTLAAGGNDVVAIFTPATGTRDVLNFKRPDHHKQAKQGCNCRNGGCPETAAVLLSPQDYLPETGQ